MTTQHKLFLDAKKAINDNKPHLLEQVFQKANANNISCFSLVHTVITKTSGKTLLHLAFERKFIEKQIIDTLICNGADLLAIDNKGFTPLMIASINHVSEAIILKSLQVAKNHKKLSKILELNSILTVELAKGNKLTSNFILENMGVENAMGELIKTLPSTVKSLVKTQIEKAFLEKQINSKNYGEKGKVKI